MGFRYEIQLHWFPSFKRLPKGWDTVEKTDSHEQAIQQTTRWLSKPGVKVARIYDHLFGQPILVLNK